MGYKFSKLNTVRHAAAAKDLVTPFVSAMRAEGIKVGLYYSLPDWSHPDYTPVVFPRNDTRKWYRQKGQNKWEPWDRFMDFNLGQIKELDSQYHPDLYWFDGELGTSFLKVEIRSY